MVHSIQEGLQILGKQLVNLKHNSIPTAFVCAVGHSLVHTMAHVRLMINADVI
jgi:hypothetical protein